MIAGTKEIKTGTHIWTVYKNTLVLGVLLCYEENNLKIIIPISKTKCSYLIKRRDDPNLFLLKDKENAEKYFNKFNPQPKKKYKFFLPKK